MPLVVGLIGVAVFTAGAAEVDSNVLAVGCITLAMMCGAMCSGLYWALASAIAPSNCTASTGSLANFGGYIGGAVVPTATGFIVQATGSFTPALLLGGAIALIFSTSYLVLIKNEKHGLQQAERENREQPSANLTLNCREETATPSCVCLKQRTVSTLPTNQVCGTIA